MGKDNYCDNISLRGYEFMQLNESHPPKHFE
jgi:hypothetical protein